MPSPFSVFAQDTVDLIKADGTTFPKERAQVNLPHIIFHGRSKFPVDAGDKIVRHLPFGRTENYEVIDADYMSGPLRGNERYVASVVRTN
jgi:hypothetical protein